MRRGLLAVALALACIRDAPASMPTPSSASAPATSTASSTSTPTATATATATTPPPAGPGRVRGPLRSEAAAFAAFQQAFAEEIVPVKNRPVDLKSHAQTVADRKNLAASRLACREGMRRVTGTLSPKESDLILFASPAGLDRDGQCWEVRAKVSVWNEILGYLDPATGALLFAWFVPEG